MSVAGMTGGDTIGVRTQEEEPRLDFKQVFRIFTFMKPYARLRDWCLFLSALRSILRPTQGFMIGAIINGPITSRDYDGVLVYSLLFLVLSIVTEVVFRYRMLASQQLGERVAQGLRNQLFEKLQSFTLSYYAKTKLGSLLSRYISDIEQMRRGVHVVFFFGIMLVGQMLVSSIFMLVYNPLLFCVVLVVAPAIYGINIYFRGRLSKWSRATQRSQSRLTSKVAEAVNGMKIIQSFARERLTLEEYEGLMREHAGNNENLAKNSAIYLPLLEFNTQVFLTLLFSIGAYGSLTGSFQSDVGDFIAFFFLANYFFTPVQNIGRIYTQALSAAAGAERVFGLLDTNPDWKEEGLEKVESLAGRIDVQNLNFYYEKGGRQILKEVSFAAPAGQSLALVGHTGSGKTTLANLISKHYLAGENELLIDGRPIEALEARSLRSFYGIVTQETFLFNGSIIDNVKLGRETASKEEAIEAIESLGCMDLLENLPDGLETKVGENGKNLSNGQRQLVCFARAMLRDPRVLILDEATSSVDSITEIRLQQSMKRLMSGRTTVMVAHRLSAVTGVDKIVVLEQGQVIEEGNHASLIAKGGCYARMYKEFLSSGGSDGER